MKRDTSQYRVGDVRWPSVTEVLSLTGWSKFDGIPRAVLDRAADRGKWVHAAVQLVDEDDFDDGQIPVDRDGVEQPSWLGYVAAYKRFRAECDLTILRRETFVRSEAHRFVGTFDIDGTIRGVPAVVEIKTPESVAPSWPIQLSGYQIAIGEPRKRFSLRLRRDETYRLDEFTATTDRGLFLAAVATVWAQREAGLLRFEQREIKEVEA